MASDLDDVDRTILHLLQADARHTTAREIADETDVSASTVRNRIDRLEREGVIRGYQPDIDYELAGLPLEMLFVVTAPPTQRTAFVEELLDVAGVVDVCETLTGRQNIYVQAVATSKSDVGRLTDAIHELGLEVESSEMISQRRAQPFDHFTADGTLVEEDAAGESE